jgi:hypothetical protein
VDTGFAGAVAGPFAACCALLAIAGIGKLVRPRPAREAVAAAGLPVPRAVVAPAIVALGSVEVAAGIAGLVIGGPAALAVAIAYFGLGAFAWRLWRRAPVTPCGCLGSSTATVSRGHLALDAGATAVALVAAGGGSPLAHLAGRPLATLVFAGLVGCGVKLATLLLDALPTLERAMKEGAP